MAAATIRNSDNKFSNVTDEVVVQRRNIPVNFGGKWSQVAQTASISVYSSEMAADSTLRSTPSVWPTRLEDNFQFFSSNFKS